MKVTEYTLAEIAERHGPVLRALKESDGERAEREIRRHITELADRVLDHLKAGGWR